MTHYRQQEGAAQVYTPRKHEYYSYHSLMVFIAVIHMVANLWLRPGNSHTANNTLTFLDDSLDKPAGKQILLLRAQIVVQPLQRALVEETSWWAQDGMMS